MTYSLDNLKTDLNGLKCVRAVETTNNNNELIVYFVRINKRRVVDGFGGAIKFDLNSKPTDPILNVDWKNQESLKSHNRSNSREIVESFVDKYLVKNC